MNSGFDGGIGVDLVEVERIDAAWRRFQDRFLERLFTADEVAYCLAKARPAESLAARFAAKEAFAKAWSGPVLPGWHDVEVAMQGKPVFRLRGAAAGTSAQLSLSHTERYAVAMVRLGPPGGEARMIPLVTAAQMRAIDRAAIDTHGVPALDLMEQAGRGVAQAVERRFGNLAGQRILIVCGKGNNGGDGFVAARHLRGAGAHTLVALLGRVDEVSDDAQVNATRYEDLGGDLRELCTEAEVERFISGGLEVDLVIDALLGTGTSGEPRGLLAPAIRALNQLDVPVVAVDIPTGIDADTGAVAGLSVVADHTVTLGLPKRGHYLYPARERVGRLDVVDIGLPDEAVLASDPLVFLLEARDAGEMLPLWRPDAHKGSRGRLLVVGGSVGLTGAVALCCEAALRGGAGLVTAGVPASLNDLLEVKLTEAMTLPLPEADGRCLGPAAVAPLDEFAGRHGSGGNPVTWVIGPGLGRAAATQELVRALVALPRERAVLDADALYALRDHRALLRDAAPGRFVLTPHPGEAEWLLGRPTAEILADRIDLARAWAQEYRQVLVLKGAPTVVATPEGEAFVNPTGGPALATGGTGDVLAGLIGGLLAQGLSPVRAALLGVFAHGFAADRITARRGEYGLVAGELAQEIPGALNELAGVEELAEEDDAE